MRPRKLSINLQLEKAARNAFLNSKGVKPGQLYQLDLLFPETIGERSDQRFIPNDYARSSLYTARNKNEPRKTLTREKLFHYNEYVTIVFTGIELRAEDDEIVWLQILNYGKNVPFGEPFEFSVKDLVEAVNWSKNGRNYDCVRECISRLRANEVLALNSKASGTSASIFLIANYTSANDAKGKPTRYRVWIDPNLIHYSLAIRSLVTNGRCTETYLQLRDGWPTTLRVINSHLH